MYCSLLVLLFLKANDIRLTSRKDVRLYPRIDYYRFFVHQVLGLIILSAIFIIILLTLLDCLKWDKGLYTEEYE